MNVTSADTTKDVFHFAVTPCVSHRKNTVDAISAMDINQNEIPTKSSAARLAAAWAKVGSKNKNNKVKIVFTLKLARLNEKPFPLLRTLFFII